MEINLITLPRVRILQSLKHKKDMTLEDICKETKISRGNITHHLKILKERGLITISKRHKELKGKPAFINLTSKATPLQKETIDKFEKLINLFNK